MAKRQSCLRDFCTSTSSSTNDSDSKRSKEDEHVESDSGSIDMNEEVSDYSVVSHVYSKKAPPNFSFWIRHWTECYLELSFQYYYELIIIDTPIMNN